MKEFNTKQFEDVFLDAKPVSPFVSECHLNIIIEINDILIYL